MGSSRRDHQGSDANLEKFGKAQLIRGVQGACWLCDRKDFRGLRKSSQKQKALASTEKKLPSCTEHFGLVLAN